MYNLTSVIIPSRGETIGNIFSGCDSLADEDGYIIVNDVLYGSVRKGITSISIPNHVKVIVPLVFEISVLVFLLKFLVVYR